MTILLSTPVVQNVAVTTSTNVVPVLATGGAGRSVGVFDGEGILFWGLLVAVMGFWGGKDGYF